MHGDESLLAALKSALAALGGTNAELARTIEPIVLTNYACGRIASVRRRDENFNAKDYVDRVVRGYKDSHEIVRQLQKNDVDTWELFYVKLQKWAYRYLQRRHFADSYPGVLFDHAVTCATDAAQVILNKPFPYDVHFDPWACRLLQNICLRHMEREIKAARDNQGQEPIDLDSWEDWLPNLSNPIGERESERAELNQDLLAAVDRLSSEARKRLILLHYFEEKSLAEVAQVMDLNMNATYKLHHDALQNLRQIWNGTNRSRGLNLNS